MSLVPETVSVLIGDGHRILVEPGCGSAAGFPDAAYEAAGAEVAAREDGAWAADLVVTVTLPDPSHLRDVAVLGLLAPFDRPEVMARLASAGVTAFAFEAVPRITRAQTLDALSSQATAAGYSAALLGAATSDRFFPMLTTAAGTVRPAEVVVLGAGVAGLQAIATARRLGAVVFGFDIREEATEQIRSVGATPIAVPSTPADPWAESGDGATTSGDEDSFRALLASPVARADVVIATAAIPGRRAPVLITAKMVEAMRPGAVIVDLSAATGGNCELTVVGKPVDHHGVRILGYTDLASRVAHDASRLLARNTAAFVRLIAGEGGAFDPPWDDEIVSSSCITRDGRVVHPWLTPAPT